MFQINALLVNLGRNFNKKFIITAPAGLSAEDPAA
jgi:hypothetical protein